MFIYSVTIALDKEVEQEWLDWMKRKHIPDVLNTGCFKGYNIFQVYSAYQNDGVTYNIQYTFEKIEDIENYQKNFAPELQKEHKEKFDGKFTATRTVLRKID